MTDFPPVNEMKIFLLLAGWEIRGGVWQKPGHDHNFAVINNAYSYETNTLELISYPSEEHKKLISEGKSELNW